MRILLIVKKFAEFTIFLRILKMLMIFFKFAIVKRTDRVKIFDVDVLIQLDVQENSTGLLVYRKMSIPKFKHKMQIRNLQSEISKKR